MSDVRQVLAEAQAAEARGDKEAAIGFLRRAAELYRDGQNHLRALKMLRHIRRLEGQALDGDPEPLPSELPPDSDTGAESLEPPPGESRASDTDELPTARTRPRRVLEDRAPVLADPAREAWCSFCCRPSREVGALVGGPTGSFICASCLSTSAQLLGVGTTPQPMAARLLPVQQAAAERLGRASVGLLLGPKGSGKSTVLAALHQAVCLDVEGPLTALPPAARVVVAVRCVPPPPPLVLGGQPVYDTATLVAACAPQVPEEILARVDTVAVLPAFERKSLLELATLLGQGEGAPALVDLALKASSPAQELKALLMRLR